MGRWDRVFVLFMSKPENIGHTWPAVYNKYSTALKSIPVPPFINELDTSRMAPVHLKGILSIHRVVQDPTKACYCCGENGNFKTSNCFKYDKKHCTVVVY